MIKNLKRTATLTISQPNSNGESTFTIKTQEIVEMELEYGIRYDSAIRQMQQFFYDSQVPESIRRLYKH